MIDKRQRIYQAFGTFLSDFVRDLNFMADEGWSVLVEGPRDKGALVQLGFKGTLVTVSVLGRSGAVALSGSRGVIILTDLDREGAVLASRFVRLLSHEGVATSLRERRRLKAASRGVFLHIENLGRFAGPETLGWGVKEGVPTARPRGNFREGLRRFRRVR